LEPYTPPVRQVTEQPVQRVARAGKRIEDDGVCRRRRVRGNSGNVLADRICQSIARAFDRRSSENADTLRVPFGRRHAVDRDVVTIAIAIDAVTLHLPELEDLVTFGDAQQQLSIVPHGVARAQAPFLAPELREPP